MLARNLRGKYKHWDDKKDDKDCQTDVLIKILDRLIETDWDDTRTLLYHQHSVVTS